MMVENDCHFIMIVSAKENGMEKVLVIVSVFSWFGAFLVFDYQSSCQICSSNHVTISYWATLGRICTQCATGFYFTCTH